jgi:hypothetical protein
LRAAKVLIGTTLVPCTNANRNVFLIRRLGGYSNDS